MVSGDRRSQERGSPDRRQQRRSRATPPWGYAVAFLGAAALLTGFWWLVY